MRANRGGMSYKAIQRVYSDKLERQRKAEQARLETEVLAKYWKDKVEAEGKAKAEADHIAKEKPFIDEVVARLAEYQNTKNN